MYEHMRNELNYKLSTTELTREEINIVCTMLDEIAISYEISEKSTELVLYENQTPMLVEMFIESKKLEGISDKTEILYAKVLNIFFDTMQKTPKEITTNDIRCFLVTYKRQRNVSDRTLDKYRQIVHGFFEWCVNEEYLIKNPCKNIKEIKFEVKPRKSLTRMELEKLRRACTNKRDRAIVDVLYSTGCRVSELSNMKISDINTDNKSVHIIGKGNKHNTCYFNTNAQISLNEYIAERKDDSEYLFVTHYNPRQMTIYSIERVIKNLGKSIGLDISPHILRHTFATLTLEAGASITDVQKMLGHASTNTTLIYAEISQANIKNSHHKYVV